VKASDIKLVFHSSTIKMMHGPINIRFWITVDTEDAIFRLYQIQNFIYLHVCVLHTISTMNQILR